MQWLACARVNLGPRTCLLTAGPVVTCAYSLMCRAHRTPLYSEDYTTGHLVSAVSACNRFARMVDHQLSVWLAAVIFPSRLGSKRSCR